MPQAKDFSHGPLTGIRVIDLTAVIMGPYATKILGDFGADVIKVESPDGDSLRGYKPSRSPGMSGKYMNINRNKRSLGLDLKKPEARAVMRKLIATADVFVHSMRKDAIERIGLGYEDVARDNPDIVYCGGYGFGAGGPYNNKAAYDDVIQAGSGLASLSAREGGAPSFMPTVLCDKLAGQTMAYAILAALVRKLAGGGGANVEVPMLETSIEFTLVEYQGGATFVPPLGPLVFPRASRRPFQTADGWACILPYSTQNWRDFCAFVGRPEVMEDPRFAILGDRARHIGELYAVVEEAAVKRTTAEWVAFCDSHSIPCMPVLALEDLPDDPHVKAVNLFQEHEHPTEGRYRVIRSPVSFDGATFGVRRHAPRHGANSAEILEEAGFGANEIAALRASGVVGG